MYSWFLLLWISRKVVVRSPGEIPSFWCLFAIRIPAISAYIISSVRPRVRRPVPPSPPVRVPRGGPHRASRAEVSWRQIRKTHNLQWFGYPAAQVTCAQISNGWCAAHTPVPTERLCKRKRHLRVCLPARPPRDSRLQSRLVAGPMPILDMDLARISMP